MLMAARPPALRAAAAVLSLAAVHAATFNAAGWRGMAAMATPRPVRLDKLLSNRGVGSRTHVAKLVKAGMVEVDGEIMKQPSQKIRADAEVTVDGVAITRVPLLALLHKPTDVLTSMGASGVRETLLDVVDDPAVLKSMHPVGRLDADTSGLLLFSSSGDLTHRLLNPRFGLEREYEAVVEGHVDEDALRRRLADGVATSDGTFKADLLWAVEEADWVGPSSGGGDEYDFEEDEDEDEDEDEGDDAEDDFGGGGAAAEVDGHDDRGDRDLSAAGSGESTAHSRLRVVVREGKYRMVRRVLFNAGAPVVELHRVRYGGVELGGLERGALRHATAAEEEWAKALMQRRDVGG